MTATSICQWRCILPHSEPSKVANCHIRSDVQPGHYVGRARHSRFLDALISLAFIAQPAWNAVRYTTARHILKVGKAMIRGIDHNELIVRDLEGYVECVTLAVGERSS